MVALSGDGYGSTSRGAAKAKIADRLTIRVRGLDSPGMAANHGSTLARPQTTGHAKLQLAATIWRE